MSGSEQAAPVAIRDHSDRSLTDLISLAGRTAVVTGATRGLGKAIAGRLGEAGAKVLIAGRDEPEAKRVAAELDERTPDSVWSVVVDVTDSDAVRRAADRAVELGGSLDIWVNAAGIYPMRVIPEIDDEFWDRTMDVNVRGTFVGAREAARQMIAGGREGVIINISSTTGFRSGNPGAAHYTTSKHAIVGLTKSLAVEFGPYGIRTLGIAPAAVMTPGMLALEKDVGGDFVAKITRRVQLGRVGVPDDVARAALFCASDLSAYMTGSTIAVDGGDLSV